MFFKNHQSNTLSQAGSSGGESEESMRPGGASARGSNALDSLDFAAANTVCVHSVFRVCLQRVFTACSQCSCASLAEGTLCADLTWGGDTACCDALTQVVVCGFGPVGQTVASMLTSSSWVAAETETSWVGFDLDPGRVREARKRGEWGVTGVVDGC